MLNITGERIKEKRLEKEWSQDELAKRLDVNRTTIAKWESGDNNLKQSMVKKVADVLGCTPGWLVGYEGLSDIELTNKYLYDPIWDDGRDSYKDLNEYNKEYIMNIPINNKRIKEEFSKCTKSISEISYDLEFKNGLLSDLLHNRVHKLSKVQLVTLSEYLNVPYTWFIKNDEENISVKLSEILTEIDYIKNVLAPISANSQNNEDTQLLDAYHSADDLTKAMVRRTLGIE